MAEVCKDIDAALANLNRKIDEQNAKIRELERKHNQCCKDKDNNNNNSNTGLEKRVKELEKNQEALKTGIVQTLNNFADIENTSREFTEAFQGLYEMVTPLIDVVSTVVGFLGADTE